MTSLGHELAPEDDDGSEGEFESHHYSSPTSGHQSHHQHQNYSWTNHGPTTQATSYGAGSSLRYYNDNTRRDFQIFVRNLDGRNMSSNVNKDTTVLQLKQAIQNKIGIAVSQQRLIFNGQQLENQRTLNSYNIKKDSTVELMGRLRGG